MYLLCVVYIESSILSNEHSYAAEFISLLLVILCCIKHCLIFMWQSDWWKNHQKSRSLLPATLSALVMESPNWLQQNDPLTCGINYFVTKPGRTSTVVFLFKTPWRILLDDVCWIHDKLDLARAWTETQVLKDNSSLIAYKSLHSILISVVLEHG